MSQPTGEPEVAALSIDGPHRTLLLRGTAATVLAIEKAAATQAGALEKADTSREEEAIRRQAEFAAREAALAERQTDLAARGRLSKRAVQGRSLAHLRVQIPRQAA